MQRDMIIVDNFYDDPESIVQYAHSLEYMCPYNLPTDDGDGIFVPWRTSRFRSADKCPFKSSRPLLRAFETITGERIDMTHWRRDFPVDANGYPAGILAPTMRSCWWNCAFHTKHWSSQKDGEGVHSHTDSDTWSAVGVDGWAGIVYLYRDRDLQTGLRTWRNKNASRQHDWMTPPENWQLVDTLGAVYNRLILHRGGIPHSGSPGWGNSVLDGRLFQTFFFRVRRAVKWKSVGAKSVTRMPVIA